MQYKVLKECVIESIFYQKGQLYRPSKEMSNFALEALLKHGFLKQVGQSANFEGGEMYRYLSSEGLVGVDTWGEHPLIDNYCPNCGDDVRMPI